MILTIRVRASRVVGVTFLAVTLGACILDYALAVALFVGYVFGGAIAVFGEREERTPLSESTGGDHEGHSSGADGTVDSLNGETGAVHVADVIAYAVIATCALLFLYSAARFCGVTG